MDLDAMAYRLLKSEPEYLDDARRFARVGKSVVGSVLSLTTGSPRWATERAVMTAVRRLDREHAAKEGTT